MGLLELQNAVVPVTGEFVTKKVSLETVSCAHCDKIIDIVIKSTSRIYNSEHVCSHCGMCLCIQCGALHFSTGLCEPHDVRRRFFEDHKRWPKRGEATWKPQAFTANGS